VVRGKLVEFTKEPLVPKTVTLKAPISVIGLMYDDTSVRVELPLVVTEEGEKLAVTPCGRLLNEGTTIPVNPLVGNTLTS